MENLQVMETPAALEFPEVKCGVKGGLALELKRTV
jgi:hypothetical protein